MDVSFPPEKSVNSGIPVDTYLGETYRLRLPGVVAPWCNPLTLQPEPSGRVGSSPGRAPPLERHDKGSQTRLGLLYFCDPSAWR